jgi:hypothetical protein
MKSTALMVAVAALLMFSQSAQAHRHRYGGHHVVSDRLSDQRPVWGTGWTAQSSQSFGAYHADVGGRPAAWCGWEMRQLVGSDPGPSFNLARNWAHWGHSGPAGIGAVVVWSHHVGKIVGQENGQWIIESGNDGRALRTRAHSIEGAIAIRWG